MSNVCYVRIDFADNGSFKKFPSPDSTILRTHNAFYQHYFYMWFPSGYPLRGYVCGIDCSPPSYKIEDRVTDENFIVFIYDGKGTVNGKPFGANQFFVLKSNQPTTMISDKDEPWKLCWLAWRGSMSEHFQKIFDSFEHEKIYAFPNAYGMQRVFSSMLYIDHSHTHMTEMVSYFADYVISMVSKNMTSVDLLKTEDMVNQRKLDYVEKAKSIIAEQYSTINIAKLSKMLYLNSKYFCQIFHEVMGIPPQQYLIDVRLKNSIFYLEDSNMTLKSIAEACGYSSYTGYVDAFRKKYGVSPKKYRKS